MKKLKLLPYTCQCCGKVRYATPSVAKRRRFCSHKCHYRVGHTKEANEKNRQAALVQFKDGMPQKTKDKIRKGNIAQKIPFVCPQCNSTIYILPHEIKHRKYCSLNCKCNAGLSEKTKKIISKCSLEQFKHGMPQETCDKISNSVRIEKPTDRQLVIRHYMKAHEYVKIMNGPANYYLCIDCDKPARDWSNIDHKYSLNPDDYLPRCVNCHHKYDVKLRKYPCRLAILNILKNLLDKKASLLINERSK